MKTRIYLLFIFVLFFVGLSAQTKMYTVVKFNGDSIVCDYLMTGREFYYQIKGSKKVKLKWDELRYYTYDGGKKHTVTKENLDFEWEIENDSVVLGRFLNTAGENKYSIWRKNDNKTCESMWRAGDCFDALSDYFGGNCPEFDKLLKTLKPKFQKTKLPGDEWIQLLNCYIMNCHKK